MSRELEIEYVGFGTHAQTIAAFGAAVVVKDRLYDANLADDGPEGAERTQMTAPAAFKKQKIQRKDARDGRDKSRSDAPDKFAPQEGLRTYPFKGSSAGDGRSKSVRQLTTAVGDGAVAATHACQYVDRVNGNEYI